MYFCNIIMKLRAVIERITYQNGENGYSILKARVKGYDDLVTLVGNMLDVTVGTVLVADGQWKVNRQYGSQFVVESYEEAMPAHSSDWRSTSAVDLSKVSDQSSPNSLSPSSVWTLSTSLSTTASGWPRSTASVPNASRRSTTRG